MAKVSVANSTFTTDLANSSSTASFNMGSRPPWCTPTPLESISSTLSTWGSWASSGLSLARSCDMSDRTSPFSLAVSRSRPRQWSAISSHLRLLKLNTTAGRSPKSSPSSSSSVSRTCIRSYSFLLIAARISEGSFSQGTYPAAFIFVFEDLRMPTPKSTSPSPPLASLPPLRRTLISASQCDLPPPTSCGLAAAAPVGLSCFFSGTTSGPFLPEAI